MLCAIRSDLNTSRYIQHIFDHLSSGKNTNRLKLIVIWTLSIVDHCEKNLKLIHINVRTCNVEFFWSSNFSEQGDVYGFDMVWAIGRPSIVVVYTMYLNYSKLCWERKRLLSMELMVGVPEKLKIENQFYHPNSHSHWPLRYGKSVVVARVYHRIVLFTL